MEREIGNLVARVTLDGTRFQHGVSQLNRQLKLAQSEFQVASKKLGDFGNKSDQLRLKTDLLTKQIEIGKQKIDALKRSLHESVEAKGKDAKATQELQLKLNRASAELASFENELINVNRELKKPSMHPFSQQMDRMSKKLKRVGSDLMELGGSLTLLISGPLAALGISSTKSAISFESAFAGVRKTVEATEPEFQKMKESILEMGKHLPASVEEIAKVAEVAGQLGVQKKNLMDFTRIMVDLGVATNMTSDEAATALARFANITQMPQTEMSRLGSTIVDLGNHLAATESEMVEMGLRIAGAGHQIGLTEAQIVSFAGSLASVGINAEAGGSAISRTMIEVDGAVRSGGKKLQLFAKVAGSSSAEFKQAFKQDAAGAIIGFVEGLGKLNKKGEDTFKILKDLGLSEILVRDALLRASGAGDLFRKSLDQGTKAWKKNTALTKEAAERYKTTESKMKMFQNRMKQVSMKLGEAIAPVLTKLMDLLEPVINVIDKMVKAFSKLSPTTQAIILLFAGLAAILGPVILILGALFSAVAGIAAGLAVFGVSLTAVLAPIALIVAAIAALIAIGVVLYKNWGSIKKTSAAVWESITKHVGTWKDSICKKFHTVMAGGVRFFKQLKETVVTKTVQIKDKFVRVIHNMIQFLGKINLVTMGKNILQGLLTGMSQLAGRVWEKAKEIATGIKNRIQQVLKIASPSKVMIQLGRWTGEGLVDGMKASLPQIAQQATHMAKAMVPSHEKVRVASSSVASLVKHESPSHVQIYFQQPVVIREEADIQKIARSIAREARMKQRARGRIAFDTSFPW